MTPAAHMPEDRLPDLAKAKRLAWWSIAYLVSAILLLALVLGSSEALKTAWFDDLLSLAPPALFLIGNRVAARPASQRYPFGFGRAVSAAYLVASTALLGVGAYLLVESVFKLIRAERPSIGGLSIFGRIVWQGWAAVPVLLYSMLPAVVLGRMKLPLADRLHDKVLFADAKINEADWQTGAAALLGIVGVAFGLWWADAAAGALISLDILYDGGRNIRAAFNDLIDRRPQRVLDMQDDPLPGQLVALLRNQDWVRDATVRLREQGRQLLGEALVVPRDEADLVQRIEDAARRACASDWRLTQFVIMPVRELSDDVKGRSRWALSAVSAGRRRAWRPRRASPAARA